MALGCSRQRRLGWKAEPDLNPYLFVVKGTEQDHSRVNHIEKTKCHRHGNTIAPQFILVKEITNSIDQYRRHEPHSIRSEIFWLKILF